MGYRVMVPVAWSSNGTALLIFHESAPNLITLDVAGIFIKKYKHKKTTHSTPLLFVVGIALVYVCIALAFQTFLAVE